MAHFVWRNVNRAFTNLVRMIHTRELPTVKEDSRNGPVLRVPEPVTVTYTHPTERVLFNPARDCNPFFHLYEALWMIGGRNDLAPLSFFTKQIKEYSDDGLTLNGAYGYRWRFANSLSDKSLCKRYGEGGHVLMEGDVAGNYWRWDQLYEIVEHLKRKPESRRAVLQMWNVEDDLLKIDTSKDVCCNTHAYFSIRHEASPEIDEGVQYKPIPYLDMTVCNRSNDMIWGMLGANAVHFSFLQEYLAAHLGVEVGVYNQFTNNLHVYLNNWKPQEWMAWDTADPYPKPHLPLVQDPNTFDAELQRFLSIKPGGLHDFYKEPFLQEVARPAVVAYYHYKQGYLPIAVEVAHTVKAPDWWFVCKPWLLRRLEKRKAKDVSTSQDQA